MKEIMNDTSTRRRVNLKSSVKGVVTFDITVEMSNVTNQEVVAETAGLRAMVEKHIADNGGSIVPNV